MARHDRRHAARRRRLRLRPAFRRRRDRPDRRRAAARAQERAVASRQGDARADRAASTNSATRMAADRPPLALVADVAARAALSRRCRRSRSTCTFRGACSKCPYCDFNSHEARGDVPEDALRRRAARRPRVRAAVDLGPQGRHGLHRRRHAEPVLARRRSTGCSPAIRARVPLAPDAEITLEANPGTFERAEVRRLLRAPASIGCRSASRASTRRILQALGRVHDADEARARRRSGARRSSATSTST